MTTFWSWYITILTIATLVALLWLVFATRKGEPKGGTDKTMGHSFDGIEEYDNPLPKWWFMLFIGTIAFTAVYLVLYPGLGNWKGIFPATKTAGPRSASGNVKWTKLTRNMGRSSPNMPPCPLPK